MERQPNPAVERRPDFMDFVVLWNDQQGIPNQRHHFPIGHWQSIAWGATMARA